MMSLFRRILRLSPALAAALLLISCLGTSVKKLGEKEAGGTGTGETDSETFSITLAFREAVNPATERVVILQGVRDLASASLAIPCGSTGATCQCLFYESSSDLNPVASSSPNGMSVGNNSLSCTIPPGPTPSTLTKVRLRTTDGLKSTGFIDIKTTLTLEDVIGDLDKANVRGILRYSCIRTFFEGEGVSPTEVACPPSQRLGLITATYSYYLFNSQNGGNLNEKGSNSAYENPICERQFNKLNCDGAPDLRWGLYAEKAGPFQVGITMTARPEGDNGTAVYGFAALPDSAGNCPTGLVKVRPWQAQPQSIIQGSIDGTNPPSSFVNQNNNLNDTVVEETQPNSFRVFRQPNAGAGPPDGRCEAFHTDPPPRPAPGSCRNAFFGGNFQVQAVAYTNLTPVVCVIPKDLLSGLF